jgi:SAM-dependent methyltransferase
MTMGSELYTKAFYDSLRDAVLGSAEVIVPLALQLVPVSSVVDVGCGEGTWLAAFKKFGVDDILGLDGDHVDRSALRISGEQFQAIDLTKAFKLNRSFDLAVCLEVAEHLPAECAPVFVECLTRLAPVVLFSAAIPYQGGIHHQNEQWPDRWAALFNQYGYVVVDAVRRRVWEDEAVAWWYAQNTLLFVDTRALQENQALRAEYERTDVNQLRLVHPGNYLQAIRPIDPPDWTTASAFRLFGLCLRNAVRRRFYRIVGDQAAVAAARNPPDFNVLLQGATFYGIVKRPGRD